MGTTPPLVRVEAATLAGGTNNQDRYAYGDGWAFVLDGASSIDSPRSGHDGGWYAERLKNALATRLRDDPALPTIDLVADAITEVSSVHNPKDGACPTSTIALARWNTDEFELYVLGDSYAIVYTDDGATLITDDRLASVAPGLRTQYRQRLAQGSGFDATHRAILRELQQHEARYRNREGGYWIAGDDPEAARHAIIQQMPKDCVCAVALSSDGLFATGKEGWAEIIAGKPHGAVSDAARREDADPQALRHPRSKRHDDKTIVWIAFGMNPAH